MGFFSFLSPGPAVTPTEAAAALAEGSAVLIDVREKDEWKSGHAAGAMHISLRRLPEEVHKGKIPTNKTVICICQSGSRSARAQSMLKQNGIEALNLRGGMRQWRAAGLPVTR